jgi:competence protein ComEC
LARHRVFQTLAAACLFLFTLGTLRAAFIRDVPALPEGKATILGTIAGEPEEKETSVRYVVRAEQIDGVPVAGRQPEVLVSADPYPQFEYGDQVELEGSAEAPEPFETEQGRTFDYPSYLASKGIGTVMHRARLAKLPRQESRSLKRYLLRGKRAFLLNLEAVIPEPAASLGGGILAGKASPLGERLDGAFRTVGLSHITVLSGYNVTIVADTVLRLLSFLPRTMSLWFAGSGILIFVLTVGGGTTVVRACVMSFTLLLARFANRTYDAFRALLLAGAAMLLHNPLLLLHDASFQLSFLATFGLITLSPAVSRMCAGVRMPEWLREVLVSTIAAQAAVLPLLLFMSGRLSLVSLPANVFVLPFMPAAMLLTFITGLAVFISPIVALFPGILAGSLLRYMILLAETGRQLPFAELTIPHLSGWGMTAIYGVWIVGWAIKTGRLRNSVRSPAS